MPSSTPPLDRPGAAVKSLAGRSDSPGEKRAAVQPSLKLGNQAEVTFRVTEDMCPAFDGVVVHHVCSTWTIVHYMEIAGRMVLAPHLETEEEGVGSHVSCDHKGPAPVGSLVRVVATAVGLTDRELICDTFATCGQKLVAVGKTAQRVFPKAVLKRILSPDH